MKDISRRSFLKYSGAGIASLAIGSLMSHGAYAEPTDGVSEIKEISPLDMTVYCVDRFETKPGEGKAFLDYYMENFPEKAEQYGMKLESALVSPPVWLDNASNTIEVTWSIAGFNGWAAMVNASRYQPETLAFWREVRSKLVSQDRSYYAKSEDMEMINNV